MSSTLKSFSNSFSLLNWVLDIHFRSFWNRASPFSFCQLSAERLPRQLLNSTNNHLIRVTHPTKMRRYKIVACILLILSLFGFVLAAPVAIQEVCEACADAVDGGETVIIQVGPGKRVDIQEEEDLFARAQQEPSSSSPAPNYASGTPPNPSFSSEPELPEGEANFIQPASSSKAKSVSWAPAKEVKLSSGQIYSEMLPPQSKALPLPPVSEGYQPDQPASSSTAKSASLPLTKEVQLPSGHIYSEVLPPKMAAQESPLPPESENILSKLVGKLKLWRRISVTTGDIVTEGERDLQGTVDT